ncbi:hypothetical protein L3Q82_022753, partial [Scortum barcoo]
MQGPVPEGIGPRTLLLICPSTPILSIFQGLPFYHLRNIAKIRHFLSQSDAEKLVHAFVSSRLDYLLYMVWHHHILMNLITPYHHPTRVLRSQNAGLLVVPRVSRSSLGGRAFSYQAPVLSGTSSQSGSERQTQCQCLRIDLKPSFLIKLIVR